MDFRGKRLWSGANVLKKLLSLEEKIQGTWFGTSHQAIWHWLTRWPEDWLIRDFLTFINTWMKVRIILDYKCRYQTKVLLALYVTNRWISKSHIMSSQKSNLYSILFYDWKYNSKKNYIGFIILPKWSMEHKRVCTPSQKIP